LTGKVVQVLKGGLSAEVDGARVFIPASLISDGYIKDLTQFKGQELEFKIIEFEPRKRRIIGDRKQLIVEDKKVKQDEILSTLKQGDVIDGTVKNVTNFGAFVDLGGIDGLLHISEMSWGRVENPTKLYKEGDPVKVFIKDIKDSKIALSRKFPDENPWNDAAERFAVGNIVKGRVARMADFGAFIELAPGIDGLLHVSQISKDHIDKPSDVLSVGQEVEARVVELRENEHKISLSLKALNKADDEDSENPEAEETADVPATEEAPAAEEPKEEA
ncbi:MAG: S1 RNA-binding domain-containing protein, partial [Lachnospiraceae bacterium]|nr:S1 RNA-binding domain-containing protein [Lachnospiraceae bacterium]